MVEERVGIGEVLDLSENGDLVLELVVEVVDGLLGALLNLLEGFANLLDSKLLLVDVLFLSSGYFF